MEMYSAFRDTFEAPTVSESALGGVLREAGVSHVFVVGLAGDYCVKWTAIHAAKDGYETVVVEEGTKGVDQNEGAKEKLEDVLRGYGVKIVSVDGEEVRRVRKSA